jgi:hypothetical protein
VLDQPPALGDGVVRPPFTFARAAIGHDGATHERRSSGKQEGRSHRQGGGSSGGLADDDELKREGKTDRAAGSVKEKLERAKDKGEEFVDTVNEKIDRR